MEKERRYLNPYNFVPLPKVGCERKKHNEGKLTGFIECEIETKTPIFIPSQQKENGPLSFYSYPDHPLSPVIPGSEIRGCIRSVYETITNSCLSTSPNLKFANRSGTRDYKKPGLLRKIEGKWSLYEAKSYPLYDLKRKGKDLYVLNNKPFKAHTGDYIEGEFKTRNASSGKKAYISLKGFVFLGEYFNNRNEHLFVSDDQARLLKADCEIEVENLKDILKRYRDEKINKQLSKKGIDKHYGYSDYDIDHRNIMPVWYGTGENNRFYLSPASIGKNVYHNQLYDFLIRENDVKKGYQPCDNRDEVCPTCNLFGMISNSGNLSTRLRFSDAICVEREKVYTENSAKLKELSAPQIGNTEFYSDYNINNTGKWNFDNDGVSIKGRKFYWHCPNPRYYDNDLFSQERCKEVIPVKENIHFKFKVFFDRVTSKELDNLAYALDLGSANNNRCHKIGMGKPIGLGSIKIKIQNIKQRNFSLIDDSIHYELVDYIRKDTTIDLTTKEMKSFLKITDFNAFETLKKEYQNCELIYSYPLFGGQQKKGDTHTGSLKWFTTNAGLKWNRKVKLGSILSNPTLPDLINEVAMNKKKPNNKRRS